MRVLKICAVLCALVLAFCSVPAVSAANVSGWVDLLETSSVLEDGSNWFTSGATGSVTVPLQVETKLRKVDILLWSPSGQRFTSASCTAGGKTLNLDILAIGGNLTRIVGYLPDTTYKAVTIDFKKSTSSTQSYELLSFKVTPMGDQLFAADVDVVVGGYTYGTNEHIEIPPTTSSDHGAATLQVRLDIKDWRKYDSISIWGSGDGLSLDSFRASLGIESLPIEVNYFSQNDRGEWTDYVFVNDPEFNYVIESGSSFSTPLYGKYLYSVTIDLQNVDRSKVAPIYLYITGLYDTALGCSFNCQHANGSVYTADTSEMTWWTRFTAFMKGLFSPDSSASDEYQEEAGQQRDELDEMNQQLENVTKPPVDGIQMDVNDYVDSGDTQALTGALAALTGNSLMISMMCIVLTIALVGYVLYGKR